MYDFDSDDGFIRDCTDWTILEHAVAVDIRISRNFRFAYNEGETKVYHAEYFFDRSATVPA